MNSLFNTSHIVGASSNAPRCLWMVYIRIIKKVCPRIKSISKVFRFIYFIINFLTTLLVDMYIRIEVCVYCSLTLNSQFMVDNWSTCVCKTYTLLSLIYPDWGEVILNVCRFSHKTHSITCARICTIQTAWVILFK